MTVVLYICERPCSPSDVYNQYSNHTTMDIALMKSLPLFQSLEEEQIREILRDSPSRIVSYSSGAIVGRQGERVRALMILLEGKVRAQMIGEDDKRLTIDILTAPVLLAPAFVYSTANMLPVYVETIEPSRILFLDREYFLEVMKQHISVMRAFMQDISDKNAFLSKKINILSLKSLRDRLLGQLEAHGQIGTQEEMAMLLGVARPSLARVLGELIEEGIVTKEAGKYRIARH